MAVKKLNASCLLFILICSAFSCSNETKTNSPAQFSETKTKEELIALERKFLEAEFALDTAYITTLLDSTFISVSSDHLSNKQQELTGIYKNISNMRKDSIFLDSLKIQDAMVNIYSNTAVVIFVVHTYKKDKGRPTEKLTRFYDVWVNRGGNWKAVSSQGTKVEE